MNLDKVASCAENAINAFKTQNVIDPKSPAIESIINQMEFIKSKALTGKNPRLELQEGQSFSYGIIASRELSAPDELALKKFLDEVTHALYPEYS
ncbi:hypothetical protein QWY82_18935 [Simiduia curdlanivorans]|uniref:Tsi6 domain-containing protein n=1 Tax=Simiduia curdlanivorans TaxID=1492769 RepID=A0ABV8V639_9GAMM|nr:hypothetical protein [Simiduia curdlanivorans]MDN3640883.1 hypothetical protein [Simiduia curdlanivorans]